MRSIKPTHAFLLDAVYWLLFYAGGVAICLCLPPVVAILTLCLAFVFVGRRLAGIRRFAEEVCLIERQADAVMRGYVLQRINDLSAPTYRLSRELFPDDCLEIYHQTLPVIGLVCKVDLRTKELMVPAVDGCQRYRLVTDRYMFMQRIGGAIHVRMAQVCHSDSDRLPHRRKLPFPLLILPSEVTEKVEGALDNWTASATH